MAQPGWSVRRNVSECILKTFAELTTPAASVRNGNFLLMSRPPLLFKEGNKLPQQAGAVLKSGVLGLIVVLGAQVFDFGLRDVQLLTSREREILQLVVEGRSNKDIAALLNLSLYTVETHRKNLQSKLNLHSLPELILYAVRKGIIS